MEHVHKATEIREVPEREGVSGAVVLARMVHFVFGLIITLIAIRLVLLLLGANMGNPFVDFIYTVSGFFVAPFYGMFNNTPVFGQSIVDISSIVAMIVYALLSWAIGSLITMGMRRSERDAI